MLNPIIPLKLDGVSVRAQSSPAIFTLGGGLVFVYDLLGDVPKDKITSNTVFPNYIVADFISEDFKNHSQGWLMYPENKTLFQTCCQFEQKEDRLLLNTMRHPPGGIFTNIIRHQTIAKLIEIKNGALCEIGESPEPVPPIYSHQKTFVFGDYAVCMASEFVVECRSKITGAPVWKLRLHAWLYTDIKEKDGVLYFGTAGRGGRFYGVSLAKGNVVFAYDSGGTTSYEFHEGQGVMIDRKGDIVFVNIKTGAETRRVAFKHGRRKLCAVSSLIHKEKLYAAARINKPPYFEFYAVCVEL